MEKGRDTPRFEEAKQIILSGGVVIVGTETFYALAADPFKEDAVKRIFSIKFRERSKALPLIACSRRVVERLIREPDSRTRRLMNHFWPGSLTILLEPSPKVPPWLVGPSAKVGVRVPPWSPAVQMAESVGGLITATSANLSGDPNPREISMIARVVLEAVDLVLDSGSTPGGEPSTIVEVSGNEFRVMRPGVIPATEILNFWATCGSRESS